MATAAINTFIFERFPSLPPELRLQIWQTALPNEAGPVLYFYKKGAWGPHPSILNEKYDSENDEPYLDLKFYHDLLDAVQVEIPLWFVNREARHVALAWIHKHNIKIRVYAGKHGQLQDPVFVRSFDPILDALYIAVDKWNEFLCEPEERMFQLDMFELQSRARRADITRIAMPVALFQDEERVAIWLEELTDFWYSQLRVLYIVVEIPVELQPVSNGKKMQPRWGLKNMQAGSFFWNHDHGRFDFEEGEHVIDEVLYFLLQEISISLGKGLVRNSIHSFEVRPVFAIRAF